ncbi:hypothetical protein D0T87_23695 [Bacteroides sp. 51]|nr:hypothetical protein [Bacteroides sp. 51]
MMHPPHRTGSHLDGRAAFTFIAPASFLHSKTRAHVRLLGPCYKTGRMRPCDRQRPGRMVRSHRLGDRQQSQRTAGSPPQSTADRRDGTLASPKEAYAAAPRSSPGHATAAYNNSRPRARAHLAVVFETQSQPTLARAGEKCDGPGAEPNGRGLFRSANRPPDSAPG